MAGSVIVPLDGSELAEGALWMATALCSRTGAAMHLVHVRRMTPAATDLSDEDHARLYMEGVAGRFVDARFTVVAALLPEEPSQLLQPTPSPRSIAAMIVEYASGQEAEVVIMTTHGRGGLSRKWFGSVADAMLRTSTLPVLLTRTRDGDERESLEITRVLIALASDNAAEWVITAARRIVGMFEPRFTLLRVLPISHMIGESYLHPRVIISGVDSLAEAKAAERDLLHHARALPAGSAEIATRSDAEPARGILAFADDHHVDVIVVGTHSRRGVERMLLGSVADKVVRGADCTVLVVPP